MECTSVLLGAARRAKTVLTKEETEFVLKYYFPVELNSTGYLDKRRFFFQCFEQAAIDLSNIRASLDSQRLARLVIAIGEESRVDESFEIVMEDKLPDLMEDLLKLLKKNASKFLEHANIDVDKLLDAETDVPLAKTKPLCFHVGWIVRVLVLEYFVSGTGSESELTRWTARLLKLKPWTLGTPKKALPAD